MIMYETKKKSNMLEILVMIDCVTAWFDSCTKKGGKDLQISEHLINGNNLRSFQLETMIGVLYLFKVNTGAKHFSR